MRGFINSSKVWSCYCYWCLSLLRCSEKINYVEKEIFCFLQEKISVFNKPEQNEKELMEKQRKKASYNAKLAKFQSIEVKQIQPKKSDTRLKTKIFEDIEGQKDREKEAVIRKEDFKKKKEAFNDENIETIVTDIDAIDRELENELAKKMSVFEAKEPVEENITEALERERRREEFLEKQTVFGQ